jgi:hypothetical protein
MQQEELRPMPDSSRPQAFLIMPFGQDLDWLHDEILDASFKEGIDTRRADSIFNPGSILEQILIGIDNADLIFAVCTGKNANVFFELGYAWKRHRPILIAENADDLPFDTAAFRTLFYGGDTNDTDRHSLSFRLQKAIRAIKDEGLLPKGRVLTSPPKVRNSARLSASLKDEGRSHRLLLTNTGTVSLAQVDVEVPEEAQSFRIRSDELPVDVLRPGETVRLLVSIVMGGGPSIFDLTLRGVDEAGEVLEFPSKISI